jgi:hypothetical protein
VCVCVCVCARLCVWVQSDADRETVLPLYSKVDSPLPMDNDDDEDDGDAGAALAPAPAAGVGEVSVRPALGGARRSLRRSLEAAAAADPALQLQGPAPTTLPDLLARAWDHRGALETLPGPEVVRVQQQLTELMAATVAALARSPPRR